jgi:hypothetical protein
MHVTQTYLGHSDPKALVFFYYLFEAYDPDQAALTAEVETELARLGKLLGRDATLYIPHPSGFEQISGEVVRLRDYWGHYHERLPGLLITATPLGEDQAQPIGECVFWSFAGRSPDNLRMALNQLAALVREHVNDARSGPTPSRTANAVTRFIEALELKPSIGGIGIDLKKLFAPGQPT